MMLARTVRKLGTTSRERGFTLIELLIVVAIIGILASVAVVNLLNALDKGKQKRTMADLRTIGSAVEAYAVDVSKYPAGITTWAGLESLIDPTYIRNPPDGDGWGNPWAVNTTATGSDYSLVSPGKDGVVGPQPGGQTGDFNCDIVFSGGQFFQWPEGTQS